MKKNCTICSSEFEARGKAKYCGQDCRTEAKKRSDKAYRDKNKELRVNRTLAWREANREKHREYYRKTKDRRNARRKAWRNADRPYVYRLEFPSGHFYIGSTKYKQRRRLLGHFSKKTTVSAFAAEHGFSRGDAVLTVISTHENRGLAYAAELAILSKEVLDPLCINRSLDH